MIPDQRFDLNRYIGYSKPNTKIKTNFGDQYRTDASESVGGQYPWDPGRSTTADLLNRVQSRKFTLNAHLGYVDPQQPLTTQLFLGQGRFVRHTDYDFQTGNPITDHKPQQNPDFNPVWVDAYKISPTIPPNKRAKSPMPTAANPDPHGYIMQMAQQNADDTVNPTMTVARLLSKSKTPPSAEEQEVAPEPGPDKKPEPVA